MSSDAIVILKADHKEIRDLFRKFQAAGDKAVKTKEKIAGQIIELLTVHTYIENEVMYPEVCALLPELKDDVLESYEEHHVADVLCMELAGMPAGAERFDAKVTVLIENVTHHIEEEEQDWFPKVRAGLTRKQLQELGAKLEQARKKAPRSPAQPSALKKTLERRHRLTSSTRPFRTADRARPAMPYRQGHPPSSPRPPAAPPAALPDPEGPTMTSDIRHDPLAELSAQGVAVWLDDLSRELLASGELESLTTGRHVVGVTTNPTIFASALAKGDRYDAQLSDLAELGASTEAAVFTVTTDDVRAACDVLSPVYRQTAGKDGRVSIEVDPRLARDAAATADMARALRSAVDRDNMFVKIPATPEGLTAITQVTSEGISVNVTLIFALARYRAVMDAYLSGLEQAAAAGRDLAAIRSVASFFISRVDSEVDTRLDRMATSQATQLKGKAAIANARLAYQAHEEVIASQRWQQLAGLGARPQRPLWASTGIKNHAYPDTMYVTELVAAGTVNTMPGTTLAAFADHGEVTGDTITGRYHDARNVLDQLAKAGVDFNDVTGQLEREGLAKFENSWNELSHTIAAELHRNHPARQS